MTGNSLLDALIIVVLLSVVAMSAVIFYVKATSIVSPNDLKMPEKNRIESELKDEKEGE